MAALADVSADHPALWEQAAILARPMTPERRMADAVRALVIDMAEAAERGHPAVGMGLADAATALWTRALKFDAADPLWPDRDRFVMSGGHGGALLHALLHLTGHDQADPRAVAPRHGDHPAVEMAAGGPAQGLGAAVGMALAERLLAARFGKSLVDHRTWVVAGDADLMEGLSHEAASLAGHLRLEKLTVLYEDSGSALGADTALAASDDVLKRFAACGWAVQRVDGHDAGELASALSFAVRSKKPTLLAAKVISGFGAPSRVAAGPLGAVEARGAKRLLDWPDPPFLIPEDLAAGWQRAGSRGTAARRAWLKRLARHPQRGEFERVVAGRLPEAWHEALAAVKTAIAQTRPSLATWSASQQILAVLAQAVPELMGGLADFGGVPPLRGAGTVAPGSYGGRTVLYGHREHVMAAAGNGLALHGGVIPSGAASLFASDTMRPALLLAGAMRRRVIHVLTEEAPGDAGAEPAQRGIAQLAGLRAIPNLFVFRPADAMETAECWELALRRADGPSLIVLGRGEVASLRADPAENRCARGGYVLAEVAGDRQATLIATGAEVALAMAARQALAAQGIAVAVVSLACWELFAQQDGAYHGQVLGGAPRLGVEAACGFGWERWLGDGGHFIGLAGHGGSRGPTADAIVAAVTRRVGYS